MKAINLFLLAAMIGIELILGIVVAPVIFYPANLIGEGVLSHFQSGLMMTQIFIKMGYLLIFVSIINLLFEIYSFAFVLYFTNTIIELQNLGEQATKSQEFLSIHNASEVVIKIILLMQVFLYFLSFKIAKKC